MICQYNIDLGGILHYSLRRCPGLHHFRRHIFRGCGRAGDQSGHHAPTDRVADRVHPAAWPWTS